MPQFDLNLLNFQNVLIYIFCVTYIYYIKEFCVFFFYIFKLPNWLYFLWIFFKKKLYLNNLFKQVLNILFLDFKHMKLLFSTSKVENLNFFSYHLNELYYGVIGLIIYIFFILLNLSILLALEDKNSILFRIFNWCKKNSIQLSRLTHLLLWGVIIFLYHVDVYRWTWDLYIISMFFNLVLIYIILLVLLNRLLNILNILCLIKIISKSLIFLKVCGVIFNLTFVVLLIQLILFCWYQIWKNMTYNYDYKNDLKLSIWMYVYVYLLIYTCFYYTKGSIFLTIISENHYLLDIDYLSTQIKNWLEITKESTEMPLLDLDILGVGNSNLTSTMTDENPINIMKSSKLKGKEWLKNLKSTKEPTIEMVSTKENVDITKDTTTKRIFAKRVVKELVDLSRSDIKTKELLDENIKIFKSLEGHDTVITDKILKYYDPLCEKIKQINPELTSEEVDNVIIKCLKKDPQILSNYYKNYILKNPENSLTNKVNLARTLSPSFDFKKTKKLFTATQEANLVLSNFLLKNGKEFFKDSLILVPTRQIENYVLPVPIDAVVINKDLIPYFSNKEWLKYILEDPAKVKEFSAYLKSNKLISLIEFKTWTSKKVIIPNKIDLVTTIHSYPQATDLFVLNNNKDICLDKVVSEINLLTPAEKEDFIYKELNTSMYYQNAKKGFINKTLFNDIKSMGLTLEKGDPNSTLYNLSNDLSYRDLMNIQNKESINYLNQKDIDRSSHVSKLHVHKLLDTDFKNNAPKNIKRIFDFRDQKVEYIETGGKISVSSKLPWIENNTLELLNQELNKSYGLSNEQLENVSNNFFKFLKIDLDEFVQPKEEQERLLLSNLIKKK